MKPITAPVPGRLFLIPALLVVLIGGCAPQRHEVRWDDGSLRRSGTTRFGKQSGDWTYFRRGGAHEAEGSWNNDHQEGVWTWWHEQGGRKQSGRYEAGLRAGTWWSWYPAAVGAVGDGQVQSIGDHDHELRTGLWRYFNTDGSLSAVSWFDRGSKSLWWIRCDEHGVKLEEGAFLDGSKVGPWTTFAADGSVKQRSDHGCPAGWQAYREASANGGCKRWGMLKDGKPDGVWLLWTDQGRIASASLRHGIREDWMSWHPGGNLASAGSLQEGKQVGKWRYWQEGEPKVIVADRPGDFAMFEVSPGSDIRIGAPDPRENLLPDPFADMKAKCDAEILAADRRDNGLRALRDLPLDAVAAAAPAPVIVPAVAFEPTVTPPVPLPILPGFWTKREEANAAAYIVRYDNGKLPEGTAPSYSSADTSAGNRQRQDLIGKPLLQKRLLTADGNVLDLDDYKGKKQVALVIMRGFAGQVCLYCASQTAALCKNIERFHAAGAEVVLVYPGPAESVPVFVEAVQSLGSAPPPLTIALDIDLQLVRGLKIEHELSKPTSIILDLDGIVRYAYVGNDRADRPSVDDLLKQIASQRPAK